MSSTTRLKNPKGSAGLIYTALFFGGMVFLYIAERMVLESKGIRVGLDLLALCGIALAVTGRLVRRKHLPDAARQVETRILICYLVSIGALVLYFAQADFVMEWLRPHFSEGKSAERYQVVLGALWPTLWFTATVPLIFIEIFYSAMDVTRTIELTRIQRSVQSGLILAMTLALLFSVNYISSEYNEKVDLSYFKTTRPSESSQKMVHNLSEELSAYLFFPGANEVQEQVEGYFDELKKQSKYFKVQTLDHAMEPELAKELGVTDNGVVLLERKKQKERITIGTRLARAKNTLKRLDNEFQKAFMKLRRTQKTVYFTVGHEERNQRVENAAEGSSVRDLRTLLERFNYQVKDLGIGQGLASEVPGDATLVVIAGPRKDFLPEEIQSLKKYLVQGGHMIVFLDPEAGLDLSALLGAFGLKYTATTLANERFHVRVTYTPADRAYLFANRYSSHPSVSTLNRNSGQLATVMLGVGPLEEIPSTEGHKVQVQFTVHSMAYTWNDLNNNRVFEPPNEKQKIYELAAVSTMKVGRGAKQPDKEKEKAKDKKDKKDKKAAADKKDDAAEMRLIVVGDADMISDKVLRNPGNGYFFIDAIKWLGGEEEYIGETTSEEDVRIMHTRKEDQVWFYLTIFGVPSLILAAGLFYTSRRRRRS